MRRYDNCVICGAPTGRNKYCCSMECYAKFKQHYRICAVCGKPFKCPPTADTKCCSKDCSHKYRANLHVKGIYDNAKDRMIAARDAYYAEHAGENHPNGKYWLIQSPGGTVYEVQNLKHFIGENPDLFDGTAKQAYDGIIKIKASMQGKRKNPCYTWKGWTLLDYKEK